MSGTPGTLRRRISASIFSSLRANSRDEQYRMTPSAGPSHVLRARPSPGSTRSATEVYRGWSTTANGPVVMRVRRGTLTRICTTDVSQRGTPTAIRNGRG